MIRALRYLFLFLLAVSLITIALANRSVVTVRLLSDNLAAATGIGWSADLPLFLIIFAGIVFGLLVGFLWEWFREHKHRSSARQKTREVTRLERELAVMRDSSSAPPKDDVLALLERKAG